MKSVDVKDLGKIAVVMGGSSGEREVSLMSGSGVLKALQSVGADVVKFDPAEQPLSDLAGIDRAFLILHGKGGEDGVIQGVMEFLKIPSRMRILLDLNTVYRMAAGQVITVRFL